MKKINVIIKDQYTLVLQEDAKSGDYIDLQSLQTVDTKGIIELISQNKDAVYNKQLEAKEQTLKLEKDKAVKDAQFENQKVINELKLQIETLKSKLDNQEKLLKSEFKQQLQKTVNDNKDNTVAIETKYTKDFEAMKYKLQTENQDLRSKLDSINREHKLEIENVNKDNEAKLNDLTSKYDAKLSELNNKLEGKDDKFKLELQESLGKQKDEFIREKEALINKYNKEKESIKDELQQKIESLTEENNQLNLYKSGKNIKQTGEDLESWCDNEVTSYMQNGLFNCEWKKDNDVVKYDDESKGSKADYIMNIYESEKHQYLLANICFDMKDENPMSVNKKKNSHYFKDLDKNRVKKGCKYAVLVSNLETDKPNDLPISKVMDPDYKDMYVVRPQYLMTFINLIVSLTVRFKELVLKEQKENEEFITQEELVKLYSELRNTYLDKPLITLQNQVDDIIKQSEAITKANDKIKDSANKIITSYINQIEKKLDKFDIKKISKKIDKLED